MEKDSYSNQKYILKSNNNYDNNNAFKDSNSMNKKPGKCNIYIYILDFQYVIQHIFKYINFYKTYSTASAGFLAIINAVKHIEF
jgi:hypothetical protein